MKKLTETTYSHKGHQIEKLHIDDGGRDHGKHIYHISKDGEVIDAADTLEAVVCLINGWMPRKYEIVPA